MKLSKKKREALYKAIHDPIMNKRISLSLKGNVVYNAEAVSDILSLLEIKLWKNICIALELDEV